MSKITVQKITPYLWFDNRAQEAAEFYCSVFKNARIISSSYALVEFELEGMNFIGINGGPQFKFTEAVSFFILCEDQEEVNYFWDHLTSGGGQESMCGWCRDKFGLSWQVVPLRLIEIMKSGDPEKTGKATDAMLKMRKIDIAELEKAYHS